MESRFHRRVLSACVGSAGVAPGAAALLGAAFSSGELWPLGLLLGGAALAPAQVLRSAASLQRAATPRQPSFGGLATAVGAVAASALAAELLAVGLGAEDAGTSGLFGPLVGLAALVRLGGLSGGLAWAAQVAFQGVLPPKGAAHFEWTVLPRERAHRRVKARLCGLLLQAAILALACVVVASLLDGAALDWRPRVLAAASVFLAGDALAEGLQDCTLLTTHVVRSPDLPTAAELLAALGQPLSTRGPGLGRWLALTGLAQAVAHRQQGAFPGVHAGAGVGCCGPPAARLPPFAADLLALPGGGGPRAAGVAGGAAGRAAAATAPWGAGAGPQARPAGPGGLFAAYLASGLEVIREFTIRVQCLAQAAQPLGPGALRAGQVAQLDVRLSELLPLFQVSVAGLTGWVCLSRDVDKCGVVQREEALGRLLTELCGALGALEALPAVCGAPGFSTSAACAARQARAEVRLGLQQLLAAFEDAGLREVSLPAEYKALIAGLCP